MELSAEKAARWPMCLAIAIDKTTRVRAVAVTALAAVFARFLAALETSAAEGGDACADGGEENDHESVDDVRAV